MSEFRVFGTVYRDAESARADIRARALELAVTTPIYVICCNSQKEIANAFLDQHGGEFERLGRHAYLYAEIEGSWVRLTD